MLKSYLKKIYEIANRGDAREESYYHILQELLKEYANSVGKKNIEITTLPKKTEAGNPDFRIWMVRSILLDILRLRRQRFRT